MGLLSLFKQITGRGYLPKVSPNHVVAPYEASGVQANYSHRSGYITLPISYTEGNAYSNSTESVAVIRLHKPMSVKVINYANQRHGLPPEVLEPLPGQYVRTTDNSVVLSTDRTVSSPEFGAQETHGAAFGVSGQTTIVYKTQESYAVRQSEKTPQASYDATEKDSIPSITNYPLREI